MFIYENIQILCVVQDILHSEGGSMYDFRSICCD